MNSLVAEQVRARAMASYSSSCLILYLIFNNFSIMFIICFLSLLPYPVTAILTVLGLNSKIFIFLLATAAKITPLASATLIAVFTFLLKSNVSIAILSGLNLLQIP